LVSLGSANEFVALAIASLVRNCRGIVSSRMQFSFSIDAEAEPIAK
jgi:hypothetical protein